MIRHLEMINEADKVLSLGNNTYKHVEHQGINWTYNLHLGMAIIGIISFIASFILKNQLFGLTTAALALTNMHAAYNVKELSLLETLGECVNKLTLRIKIMYNQLGELTKDATDLNMYNKNFETNIKEDAKMLEKKNLALKGNVEAFEKIVSELKETLKKASVIKQLYEKLKETVGDFSTDIQEYNHVNSQFEKEVQSISNAADKFEVENSEFLNHIKTLDLENESLHKEVQEIGRLTSAFKTDIEFLKAIHLESKNENDLLKKHIEQLTALNSKFTNTTERIVEIQNNAIIKEKAMQKMVDGLGVLHDLEKLIPLLNSFKNEKDGREKLVEALKSTRKTQGIV